MDKGEVRGCPTVEELARSRGGDVYEEAYEILMAVKRGELELEAPRGAQWFFSPAGLWLWLLLSLIAATLVVVFAAEGSLRYVLGAFYVLFLPGYAVVEALYPRGDEISPLERLALSIGLSLAVVPLVGLLLNYSPWGIRLAPVAIAIAAVAAPLLVYSAWRKAQHAAACR
ncbi:MAG: DUF1616 domain-containing protein [Thermoproteus sp.]